MILVRNRFNVYHEALCRQCWCFISAARLRFDFFLRCAPHNRELAICTRLPFVPVACCDKLPSDGDDPL